MVFVLVSSGCLSPGSTAADQTPAFTDDSGFEAVVVVATLDTGTNPFHPAFRREEARHPSTIIPGYPRTARPVFLTLGSDFRADVAASSAELAKIKAENLPLYVPGTNLIGLWVDPTDQMPLFQPGQLKSLGTHVHGAQASSQIAGTGFSLAPEAHLVIIDRTNDGPSIDVAKTNAKGLRWAADQPWIDIIHLNIQDPLPLRRDDVGPTTGLEGYPEAVRYAVAKGKLVVVAGGNYHYHPTETSPYAGIPGVLVAGANDNCGYADFSNLDPHVVMDGVETEAAAPNDHGVSSFGGTSSASPRVAGYAAKLLVDVRQAVGHQGGMDGHDLVVMKAGMSVPSRGPLSDGRLTAGELHEVVRKTANPNPHPSRFDGGQGEPGRCIPQPFASPAAAYPKMGYGEVSEHTLPAALAVLLGAAAIPARVEDAFYDASRATREVLWASTP